MRPSPEPLDARAMVRAYAARQRRARLPLAPLLLGVGAGIAAVALSRAGHGWLRRTAGLADATMAPDAPTPHAGAGPRPAVSPEEALATPAG